MVFMPGWSRPLSPPLSVPDFSLANLKMLAPAALATTLFALTEALAIARALADKTGQNLDANQEFIGQGMSNIFGCFFSGYVATGSFNRSGLNYQAGAKTPLAAIFAGSLLIVLVVLVAPLAAYLPNAAMAGILFLVAWHLIDFHHIRKVLRASRYETLIMATTFFSTLFLELEFAIFLGVMLSLVLYLKRTSHPRLRIRVPDPRQERRSFVTDPILPECPQLKIIRIEDSLYFGAVNYVRETLNDMLLENPGQKHLLIVAREINFIDMAGAEFLVRLAEERKKGGGGLYFYHINEGVCDHFSLVDDLQKIGAENIYETKREAIAEIFKRLDKKICARCTARIFLEWRSRVVPVN
jgi:SulP family sulfate permease